MKIPYVLTPTLADKIAFLKVIYASGLTWYDHTYNEAMTTCNEHYHEGCPYPCARLIDAPSKRVRFAFVGTDWTLVNSPEQFVRYVKRLKP